MHWIAAKRVLRYPKGTIDYELIICKGGDDLVGYSDSDWDGSTDDCKSTSGLLIQLGGSSIIWRSTKQRTVALSTMEAEFIAIAACAIDMVWVINVLEEIGYSLKKKPTIRSDNQAAISFTKGKSVSSHSRHISIKYFYVRDLVKSETLIIEYVSSINNIADIMTKSLPRNKNFTIMEYIGVNRINGTEGGLC